MPGAIFDLKNCIFGMHIPCVVLHMYRCNGSGADIRDWTGRDAAYPYAVTIHDGFCLFRAFRPQISETMQTTYEPMIGVCTVSGERVLAIDDIDTAADES